MIPILSVLLLLVAAVIAVELLARLVIRRGRYYPWPPGYQLDMTLDPGLRIGDQSVVRIRANHLGERGAPIPARPDVFRVLTVGGSAVECYYLDQENTWAAALERELGQPAALRQLGQGAVHVGNTGKSSADSRVLSIMLGHLARNYPRKVDVLVIMVGASDILRWFEWGTPENWQGDESIPLAAFLEVHPEVPFGWTKQTLALREVYQRLRARRLEQRGPVGKSMLRARQFRRNSKNIIDQLPTSADGVFARFEDYLARSIEAAGQLAHRVIVVSQPCLTAAEYTPELTAGFWNGSFGDPYKGDPKAFYSPRLIAELMGRLARHTGAVAQAKGVPFVDLSTGCIPNDPDHYYDQFHFTPLGARVVGRIVAAEILRT